MNTIIQYIVLFNIKIINYFLFKQLTFSSNIIQIKIKNNLQAFYNNSIMNCEKIKNNI